MSLPNGLMEEQKKEQETHHRSMDLEEDILMGKTRQRKTTGQRGQGAEKLTGILLKLWSDGLGIRKTARDPLSSQFTANFLF